MHAAWAMAPQTRDSAFFPCFSWLVFIFSNADSLFSNSYSLAYCLNKPLALVKDRIRSLACGVAAMRCLLCTRRSRFLRAWRQSESNESIFCHWFIRFTFGGRSPPGTVISSHSNILHKVYVITACYIYLTC